MVTKRTYVGSQENEEGVIEMEILRINEDSQMAEVAETRVEHPDSQIYYVKPLSEIEEELESGIIR